jgi:hypothetical protein
MMNKLLRHTVVLALIVAMPAVMNPAWSTTSSPATLMGRVLGEDARTPIAGAVVKIQVGDGAILSSEPTTVDGTFRLRDLAPGEYSVIVETSEGAYKVQNNLPLEADVTRLVQLSIRKDAAAAAASAGGGGVVSGGGGGGGARAYAPLIGFAALLVVGFIGSGSRNDQQQGSSDSGGGVSPSVPGE